MLRKRDVLVEVVLEPERADVDVVVLVVAARDAVEALGVDLGRSPAQVRQTVVGQVVVALIEVAGDQAGGAVEPDGEGRCHAPALARDLVAAGGIALEAHQVQAQGSGAAEGLVEVEGRASLGPAAHRAADLVERGELGGLADLIDDAAGRAAAEQHGGGALEHLDRLQVEGVAGVLAEVADPVDVDVVAGREAAEREVVTLTPAAFARGQADAGHGAERVAQGEHRALLQHLLRDDRDGLRGVLDGVRELVEARLLDLELVALAPDVDPRQRDVVLALLLVRGRRRLRPRLCRHQRQAHADGGPDHPPQRAMEREAATSGPRHMSPERSAAASHANASRE